MTPGRLLGAAVAALVVTGALGPALDLEPGGPGELAGGFIVLGSAAAGLVGLGWLLFDVVRHRRQHRGTRFATLNERPAPEAPVVWVIEDLVQDHDQIVRLRELDSARTLVARVDDTSELHGPAPPVGTEVVIVSHDPDESFEFVDAATYYDRGIAPEDDWIVLAHPVDTTSDEHDPAGAAAAPPTWPSA